MIHGAAIAPSAATAESSTSAIVRNRLAASNCSVRSPDRARETRTGRKTLVRIPPRTSS